MAESLLIRLGSQHSDVIHWLIASADKQEIIASGELPNAEQLSELTEKASTRKVTVLVPGCDVVLKALNVPAKSQRAQKQAVPYMLEDELAEDVDDLFFAYAKIKENEQHNCFVAIVAHQQIQTWLTWLSDADIATSKMIPDVLAMPLIDNSVTAIELGEQVILRQAAFEGMTLDNGLFQIIHQQWQDETLEIANFSPLLIENDTITLNPQPAELPLFLFAKHCDHSPVNLLQDTYAKKEKSNFFWQHWKLAASLVVIALFINLSVKWIHAAKLDAEIVALEEEIQKVYQDNFASGKRKKISMNRVQAIVKNKLRESGGSNSEDTLFPLMNKITPAFAAAPLLKPQTFKYDQKNNEIRIQVSGKSYQDFEVFQTTLEGLALTVTQGSQNNQGDQVIGSFNIKDKS